MSVRPRRSSSLGWRVAVFLLGAALLACDGVGPDPGPELVERYGAWIRADVDRDLRVAPAGDRASVPPIHQILLAGGWRAPDAAGVWAVGSASTLRVHLPVAGPATLRVEARTFDVSSVDVSVNGQAVGTLALDDDWREQSLSLPAGLLRDGANLIELRPVRPSTRDAVSADDARAAVMAHLDARSPSQASLRRALADIASEFPGARIVDGDTLNLPGVVVADVIPGNGRRADRWQWNASEGSLAFRLRRVAVHGTDTAPPGRLVVPYRLDAPASTVRLPGVPVRGAPMVWPASAAEAAALVPADGLPAGDGAWAFDGRSGDGCLVLDLAEPVSEPWAVEPQFAGAVASAFVPSSPSIPRAPDVLLIVLDAARADRFGVYGHGRDTTPVIDRLAADGVAFRQVFASTPYTLASMPTLLSGLSFVDHGVTGYDVALSDEVATLAESFSAAGYRTTCVSANPNSSVRTGVAQGCDAFVELWQGRELADALDPDLVVEAVAARLAEAGAEPQFVLAHLMPPHDPYTPKSEFDRFRDPAYRGSADGSRETLVALDRGRPWTDADRDEVVALYDGHLRMADDAVGRLLDLLDRHGRAEDSIVAVVSDHGEAFGEHGRFLHDSTLFDEMLQVPFIVRTPEWLPRPEPAPGRLAGLVDVAPTLLGLAGVDGPSHTSGRDLFASAAAPRVLPLRTSHAAPIVGVRSSRWKATFAPQGRPALFDVVRDPGEQVDRAIDEFEMLQCLHALTRWELETPPLVTPASTGTFGGDDLRTLRALGYVR